jgi:oligopeptide transport system ATP-binding protein
VPPLLEVDDLHMHFFTRDGVVKACDGVSFTLESGKTLGVVGESGSGKSVTAMTIMRLIPEPPGKVVSGDIRFKGESILAMSEKEQRKLRGNRIAMIFQDPMTSLNPVYRIGQQLAEPLRLHKDMSRKDAWAAAVELLKRVGIPQADERARNYPHEFSGGMRQRAMIAMALACGPDILIADEPTTALDVTIQAQILELMQEIQERTESAIIMITHDLGVVADMADHIMVMYAGKPVEYGTADEIFYNPLHPYTWGLLESLPRHDVDDKGTLCSIQGLPPSLIHLPPGCAFHPRCSYARPECQLQVPPLVDIEGGHLSSCLFSGDIDFVCQFENRVTRTDTVQAATDADTGGAITWADDGPGDA